MLRVGQEGWPLLRVCWDCGVDRICCVVLSITDLQCLQKENRMRKRSLGQGTVPNYITLSVLESEPSNKASLPGQASLSRRLHPAHSKKSCLELSFKIPLNSAEQHQNVKASNQSGLELLLQPGHTVNAHPYGPHCPSAATWFLLLLTHQVTWHRECEEGMPGKGVRGSPSCSRMK